MFPAACYLFLPVKFFIILNDFMGDFDTAGRDNWFGFFGGMEVSVWEHCVHSIFYPLVDCIFADEDDVLDLCGFGDICCSFFHKFKAVVIERLNTLVLLESGKELSRQVKYIFFVLELQRKTFCFTRILSPYKVFDPG